MMGQNDEAAVSAFEERAAIIRDVCTGFGGEMFGDAGDSMMADFGNPVQALRAAFEFQDKIASLNRDAPPEYRMPFRTGINTGSAIVIGTRRYGDDVNIAARLQELAPSDGVVVSETTWHHVRGQQRPSSGISASSR